ncbi:MAG: GtrA family protein [Clostridia bacterium]|nr:GtrA family protein [Clostridia bacterium]
MANRDVDELKGLLKEKRFGALFAGDTDNTLIQFFRYIFVGAAATLVDWGVSTALFWFAFSKQNAVAANIAGFLFGLAVNYLISTLWVFKKSAVKNKAVEFLGFAAIGLVGLLITWGITGLFSSLLSAQTNFYQLIAKVVSTAVAFLWNFFARKYLLFSKRSDASATKDASAGKGKLDIRSLLAVVLSVGAGAVILYFIIIVSRAEFHSDCVDTILWADASYRSGKVFSSTFSYACLLPFGGSLLMLPFIGITGLSMTTHVIGMTLFFLLFVLFFVLMTKEMGFDIPSSAFSGILIFGLTLSSEKMREIFWGHVIYYSLGLIFLVIGMWLFLRLTAVEEKRRATGLADRGLVIRELLIIGVLFVFVMLTSTDGISAMSIFTLPFFAAILAVPLANGHFKLKSKRALGTVALLGILGVAVLSGMFLKSRWAAGGITGAYEVAYSNYSSIEDWHNNLASIPKSWIMLFGVTNMAGKPLASFSDLRATLESVKNLLSLVASGLVALFPVIATVFYNKYPDDKGGRAMRMWIWIHWAVTAIVLMGMVCGTLSGANWRLVPAAGTSMIVTGLFLRFLFGKNGMERKKSRSSRLLAVLVIPLALSCALNYFGIAIAPANGWKSKDIYQMQQFLEEQDLTYGYATFWHAGAVTVASGDKIKVRNVTVTPEGNVDIYDYQSDDSWFTDQPGVDRYFLLLDATEFNTITAANPNFIMSAKTLNYKTLESGNVYYTLIFDHNIFSESAANG